MPLRWIIAFVAVVSIAFAAGIALAQDGDGPWSDQDIRISQWFRTLMQPDNPQISCCGDADAYEADLFEVEGDHYVAIITGHRFVTAVPLGTRIPVPNHKLKFDAGNPTGHGIIFLSSAGHVYCYVTPGGI